MSVGFNKPGDDDVIFKRRVEFILTPGCHFFQSARAEDHAVTNRDVRPGWIGRVHGDDLARLKNCDGHGANLLLLQVAHEPWRVLLYPRGIS